MLLKCCEKISGRLESGFNEARKGIKQGLEKKLAFFMRNILFEYLLEFLAD
jgi:hypothetical protein